MNRLALIAAGLVTALFIGQSAWAQVRITEVMADNSQTLLDEDGADPDWIELHNSGTQTVPLAGWRLAADSSPGSPWILGATNLSPGARLIIFASGKNRATTGSPFHTDFNLQAEGDRVALMEPEGNAIASELRFGPQRSDHSIGIGRVLNPVPLIPTHAPARLLVPGVAESGLAWTGREEPFDDSGWTPVVTGVGFDQAPASANGLMAY